VIGSWSFSGETLFGEVAQIGDYAYASSSDYPYRFGSSISRTRPTRRRPGLRRGLRRVEAPTVVRDLMLLTRSLGSACSTSWTPPSRRDRRRAARALRLQRHCGRGARLAWTFDDGDSTFAPSTSPSRRRRSSSARPSSARWAAASPTLTPLRERLGSVLGLRRLRSVEPPARGKPHSSSSSGDHRIALYGSRATLGPNSPYEWGDRLVRMLDISDPAHPSSSRSSTRGRPAHAFAGPGRIGIADGEAGFAIYDSCVPFADGFESGTPRLERRDALSAAAPGSPAPLKPRRP